MKIGRNVSGERCSKAARALAEPGEGGVPRCWQDEPEREWEIVAGCLLETLGQEDVEVLEVARVQNPSVYSEYQRDEGETLMFHGCRSELNECSICASGFQVSCCISGGRHFGSWFAYSASYSDSFGFARAGPSGVRHLFICAVSRHMVAMENASMRVVGQGGAYPMWIVKYTYPVRVLRTSSPFAYHVFDALNDLIRYPGRDHYPGRDIDCDTCCSDISDTDGYSVDYDLSVDGVDDDLGSYTWLRGEETELVYDFSPARFGPARKADYIYRKARRRRPHYPRDPESLTPSRLTWSLGSLLARARAGTQRKQRTWRTPFY
jgi:hypothetical protein